MRLMGTHKRGSKRRGRSLPSVIERENMDRMQIQTNNGSEISGGGKWLLPQEANSLSPEKKAGNQHSGAADRSPEKKTCPNSRKRRGRERGRAGARAREEGRGTLKDNARKQMTGEADDRRQDKTRSPISAKGQLDTHSLSPPTLSLSLSRPLREKKVRLESGGGT